MKPGCLTDLTRSELYGYRTVWLHDRSPVWLHEGLLCLTLVPRAG